MFKMAMRNILRQKRRSLLTGLTMFGGFVLMALWVGLNAGTWGQIINMFTRNSLGHIQIHAHTYLERPTLYKTLADPDQIGARLTAIAGVEAWTPRIFSAGLASVRDKSAAVRIIGIDPAREVRATHFDKKIVQGHMFSNKPEHETAIGRGLALNLNATVGDQVVIVSQGADGALANESFTIIALIDSSNAESDRFAFYLALPVCQELLSLGKRAHEIVVIVHDIDHVPDLTAAIRTTLAEPGLDVQPWQEVARAFYMAMQAKLKGNRVLLLIISIVVAIGVLNTTLMSVIERLREYGVLKAVGTRPSRIFRLIMSEVFLLVSGCILIGAFISGALNYFLSTHHFSYGHTFSIGGQEFNSFAITVTVSSFILPAIILFVSALAVALFPAIKAARIDPVKAIHFY